MQEEKVELKKKAIVFIDGNNWYHNSRQVVDTKYISFTKLANFICDHYKYELLQIRYYNSIPDISENELKYYQHMEFLSRLEKEGIKVFKRKLQKNSNKDALNERGMIVDSLILCEKCKPIVKENCINCLGNVSKKEKGIDVKIAVDMIRKCLIESECDVCILVSGDADFIPAILTIRDANKEVITSSVFPGYSNELRSGKFRYFPLTKSNLNKYCMKDYNTVKKNKL